MLSTIVPNFLKLLSRNQISWHLIWHVYFTQRRLIFKDYLFLKMASLVAFLYGMNKSDSLYFQHIQYPWYRTIL